jgi:hypothetical protein
MTTTSSTVAGPALFVTQAKGIQEYVLGTDKLRDMLGATELVEKMTDEILQKTLDCLGFREEADYDILSRAAGSARIKFRRAENAESLAGIWPMVCAHATPGLEVYQTVQTLQGRSFLHTIREAEKALSLARGTRQAQLPVAGPPVERSARTGVVAVGVADLPGGDREEVDAATRAKRNRQLELKKSKNLPDVFRRMSFPAELANLVPDDFDQISGRDREYLALIHADGNGLGQLFIRLEEHFKKNPGFPGEKIEAFYTSISEAITKVTRDSASSAREEVAPLFPDGKRWPLMPIVLAGDDLTLVTRADLAVPFVRCLLLKFEEFGVVALENLMSEFPELQLGGILPQRLSSGAGIVFMKPGFPFAAAYALCESIAKYAKNTAKGLAGKEGLTSIPSALAFHKITTSSVRINYSDLLQHELCGAGYRSENQNEKTIGTEGKPTARIRLTMAPYFVGEQAPSLDALLRLVEALEGTEKSKGFPKGPPRELLGLLQTDLARAQKHYERMLAVNEKNASDKLRAALRTLVQSEGPVSNSAGSNQNATPLGDALTLLGFSKKKEDSKK